MFSSKIVNSVFYNFLIDESEIFVNFGIKRGVRKLTQSFFLVEVGQPNKDCTACVGRFNNYVFAFFSLLNVDHSFEERLEIWCYDYLSLLISWRYFLMKKSKDVNWTSGGVHLDFRI